MNNTPNAMKVALRKSVASIHLKRAHEHSTKQHSYTDKHREGDHWVYEYGSDDHHDAKHHHDNAAEHHRNEASRHESHSSRPGGPSRKHLVRHHEALADAHEKASNAHHEAHLAKQSDKEGLVKGHNMRAQAAEHDVDHHSKELAKAHKEQKKHDVYRDHHKAMSQKHSHAATKLEREGHDELALAHNKAAIAHDDAADVHHEGGHGGNDGADASHAAIHDKTDDHYGDPSGVVAAANKDIEDAEEAHREEHGEHSAHRVDVTQRPGSKKPAAKGKKK